MRDFIRYLLALTVLVGGFYGASKYRRTHDNFLPDASESSEQPISVAQGDAATLPAGTASQPPLAALIDTERDLVDKLEVEVEPTLRTLPSIARPPRSARPVWNPKDTTAGDEAANSKSITSIDPKTQHLWGAKEQDKPKSPPKNGGKKRNKSKKPAPIPIASGKSAEEPSWKSASQQRESERSRSSHTSDVVRESAARLAARQGDSLDSEAPTEDPFAGITAYNPFAFLDDATSPAGDKGKRDASEQSAEAENQPENPFRIVESGVVPDELQHQWQTHQIEIGDTLPLLASRYLGDSTRYKEIYQANRQLLSDPRLLPIGVEIRIPASSTGDPSGATEPSASQWWNDSEPIADTREPAENLVSAGESSHLEADMEPIPPDALPPPGQTPWSTWGR